MKNLISVLHDYTQNTLDEIQRLGVRPIQLTLSEKTKAISIRAIKHAPTYSRISQAEIITSLSSAIDVSDETIEIKPFEKKIEKIQDNGAPEFSLCLNHTESRKQESELTSIKISPKHNWKDSVSAYQLARDENIDPPQSLDTASPGRY